MGTLGALVALGSVRASVPQQEWALDFQFQFQWQFNFLSRDFSGSGLP